jgi:hypothetical protein
MEEDDDQQNKSSWKGYFVVFLLKL